MKSTLIKLTEAKYSNSHLFGDMKESKISGI